jgi:hypothetical protein
VVSFQQSCLLGCHAVSLDKGFLAFGRNLVLPFSSVEGSKKNEKKKHPSCTPHSVKVYTMRSFETAGNTAQ